MDRDIDIRTPESVAFRYELAGLGSRCLALIVDTAIQIAIILLLVWGTLAAAGKSNGATASADKWAESIAIAIVVLVFFLVFYGYFILFEVFWNGQTPGKKWLKIRVVRDGGYPVDFGASFLRNVIRIAEQALFYYGVSAIVSLASSENKRIGDYAAGTIVVREDRYLVTKDFLTQAAAATPARASAIAMSSQERTLVNDFLARRYSLARARRGELATKLADMFRSRVGPELANYDDETLLEQL
jgi:uncharacterized RDD family membrane protein YckC